MESFSCKFVRDAIWDFDAGALDPESNVGITKHLIKCRDCAAHRVEVRSLRTGLKSVPQMPVPSLAAMRVKVTASRERSRLLLRRDIATHLKELKARAKLFTDHLLRPFAVPAAGGLLASFLCFGAIVDALNLRIQQGWSDMPVGLFSSVSIDDLSPFSFPGTDVIVQLTVDEQGRVSDFSVPQGNVTQSEMQEIGNLVLYSSFHPARAFGQPVASKILVSIHHINIRG